MGKPKWETLRAPNPIIPFLPKEKLNYSFTIKEYQSHEEFRLFYLIDSNNLEILTVRLPLDLTFALKQPKFKYFLQSYSYNNGLISNGPSILHRGDMWDITQLYDITYYDVWDIVWP